MHSPKFATLLVAASISLLLTGCGLPKVIDRNFNALTVHTPLPVSERAVALHKTLTIIDLHADTMLWERDVNFRADRGHVDLPRLTEGNVAVQAFTIVTKAGTSMNPNYNRADRDIITILAMAQNWPVPTWFSLHERTLFQAGKLHEEAARSNGKLVIIRSRDDLAQFVERRRTEPQLVAGFIGVEGAHALSGDLKNLDSLFEAGIRMMAPTHFFDNDIGGSAHGVKKGGLTAKGKEMIRRMEAKGMIVDLAHASQATIADTLAIAKRPILVSHTGVRGTCNNNRNLTDESLRGIAAGGGVIGIGYFEMAICGTDPTAIAKAVRYTADLVGVDHVGLGSDYDGMVKAPFDTSGLIQLTEALIVAGFNDEEIGKIMGGNVLRLLLAGLPAAKVQPVPAPTIQGKRHPIRVTPDTDRQMVSRWAHIDQDLP